MLMCPFFNGFFIWRSVSRLIFCSQVLSECFTFLCFSIDVQSTGIPQVFNSSCLIHLPFIVFSISQSLYSLGCTINGKVFARFRIKIIFLT